MRRWDTLLVLCVLVLLWQAVHWIVGDTALTSPYQTCARLAELLGTPRFWEDIAETARALGLALSISLACGLGLGVALGAHRLSGAVAEPILVAFYSLPKVTLYPVILLTFGLGISAKVAFGALHGVIPIALFAMSAVRNMKPVLYRSAHAMRLSTAQTVATILIPAALPEIFTGVRLGFSLTLLGVLLGEMFASKRGLGFRLMSAIGLSDVATMMAVTLLVGLFALGVNAALLALDRRLHAHAQ